MSNLISEAVAIAAARAFVAAAHEMIAAGVRQETVANALLAAGVEQWSEARGAETVPAWLMDAAGLRSVMEPASAVTGVRH